jgi:hypothetical protein
VLDQLVTAYSASLPSPSVPAALIITLQGELLQGQALEGKTLRSASALRDKTHLVSLAQHASAITLAQTELASFSAQRGAGRAPGSAVARALDD